MEDEDFSFWGCAEPIMRHDAHGQVFGAVIDRQDLSNYLNDQEMEQAARWRGEQPPLGMGR